MQVWGNGCWWLCFNLEWPQLGHHSGFPWFKSVVSEWCLSSPFSTRSFSVLVQSLCFNLCFHHSLVVILTSFLFDTSSARGLLVCWIHSGNQWEHCFSEHKWEHCFSEHHKKNPRNASDQHASPPMICPWSSQWPHKLIMMQGSKQLIWLIEVQWAEHCDDIVNCNNVHDKGWVKLGDSELHAFQVKQSVMTLWQSLWQRRTHQRTCPKQWPRSFLTPNSSEFVPVHQLSTVSATIVASWHDMALVAKHWVCMFLSGFSFSGCCCHHHHCSSMIKGCSWCNGGPEHFLCMIRFVPTWFRKKKDVQGTWLLANDALTAKIFKNKLMLLALSSLTCCETIFDSWNPCCKVCARKLPVIVLVQWKLERGLAIHKQEIHFKQHIQTQLGGTMWHVNTAAFPWPCCD